MLENCQLNGACWEIDIVRRQKCREIFAIFLQKYFDVIEINFVSIFFIL
jgi:hypothetical protein